VTLIVLYEGARDHLASRGEVLAIEKVRMKLTLDRHGNRLSGALLDENRDLNGAVLFLGPGTYEAVRIAVEPLP
jgi:hypothetical protein